MKNSADIRDKSAKHWSDESIFANRAYFLFEKQNELAIQNVKDGDSGIYRCRVDFEIGQTRNSKVNLTVICECIITQSIIILRDLTDSIALILIPFYFHSVFFAVPPERISIRDESGIDRVSVVGPYNEGDFVNINCDVHGGT